MKKEDIIKMLEDRLKIHEKSMELAVIEKSDFNRGLSEGLEVAIDIVNRIRET